MFESWESVESLIAIVGIMLTICYHFHKHFCKPLITIIRALNGQDDRQFQKSLDYTQAKNGGKPLNNEDLQRKKLESKGLIEKVNLMLLENAHYKKQVDKNTRDINEIKKILEDKK